MDCLESRRIMTADPGRYDTRLRQHIGECKQCREFDIGMRQFDSSLKQAVNIQTPANLSAMILMRQSIAIRRDNRHTRHRWGALAASALLTLSIVGLFLSNSDPAPLGEAVIAHIYEEADHMQERNNVQLAAVNKILAPFGSRLLKPIGIINFASHCRIRQRDGAHLVVDDKTGLITLLWLPGEYVREKTMIADTRFTGVIVPVYNGSVAIVGEDLLGVKLMEERLRRAGSLVS